MTAPGDVLILLAEDDARDAELVMRAMKKCPFPCDVFWVRDGVETLEFLRGEGRYAGAANGRTRPKPRLILLDLKMPKVDGLGVLRALRDDPAVAGIPVVMMTSSSEERDVVESYHLGVNSFVVKPVEAALLSATVVDICRYWLQLNRIAAT
jgi:two-component system response regulator